jgi:glutaredoxin
MKILVRITVASLLTLSFSCLAFSQIYKWRDKDGNLVISTTPPPPGIKWEKRKIEQPPVPSQKIKEGDSATNTVQQVELKRPYRDIKVIMYMTDWCPVCKKARAYLNSLGISLTEYDVDKDREREKEWLLKADSRRGVPVIDIEGIILQGLSPNRIKAAIEERSRASHQY